MLKRKELGADEMVIAVEIDLQVCDTDEKHARSKEWV